MNPTLLRLSIILLLVTSARAATDPRRALAQGAEAFNRTNHTEAARQFALAAEGAAAARLDPAVPYYNRGLALLQDGQAAPAAEQFQVATRTTDLGLQQKALFNRGNALLKLAGELETAGQQQPALQSVEEALAMYEQAMILNPRDKDPKVNFELAAREKQRLEEIIKQQPPSQDQQQSPQDKNDQKKDDQKQQDQQQQQQQQPSPGSKPEQKPDESSSGDQSPTNQPPSSASGKSEDDQEQQQQPSNATEQPQDMTREEATRLLDAMKEQEQSSREQIARDRMKMNMGQLPPVEKDW